jgi:hypothetical protein
MAVRNEPRLGRCARVGEMQQLGILAGAIENRTIPGFGRSITVNVNNEFTEKALKTFRTTTPALPKSPWCSVTVAGARRCVARSYARGDRDCCCSPRPRVSS